MMFVDDIVLIDETKIGVSDKLEKYTEALGVKGFKISGSKTEYMECNFSGRSISGDKVMLDCRAIR